MNDHFLGFLILLKDNPNMSVDDYREMVTEIYKNIMNAIAEYKDAIIDIKLYHPYPVIFSEKFPAYAVAELVLNIDDNHLNTRGEIKKRILRVIGLYKINDVVFNILPANMFFPFYDEYGKCQYQMRGVYDLLHFIKG